jgi:H+/gluconate symporter-like permease
MLSFLQLDKVDCHARENEAFMTGMVGILVALALLIYFAYRGISVLILAPAMALFAAMLSGDAPLLASYTQVFMAAVGKFIVLYFPLFLLGAIFGKLMDDSGSAESIARLTVGRLGRSRSMLAVVLSCAILTYGGVSLFVVAFTMYPIAAALFREADIPKRLIPGTIGLGAFTFTMTALPGTPSIQNAIPMPYFGTTAFAAPGLGIVTSLVMFTLGMLWLNGRCRAARAAGEGYGNHPDGARRADRQLREHAEGEGFDLAELTERAPTAGEPSAWVAIAPIVLVIVINCLFSMLIIPRWDTHYLALPKYGQADIQALRGIWAIIVALVVAILMLIAMNRRRLPRLRESLDAGANASVVPIFNTASQVGFGAVIASLAAFDMIRQGLLDLSGTHPLITVAVSVNVFAGITGSASGGLSIALQTLSSSYLEMARQAQISPALMHRVISVAAGCLGSLPHSGAVITLLGICGLTHRESYKDLFVVALLVPAIALVVLIGLGTLLGAF